MRTQAEFVSEVRRKIYFQAVINLCEIEDCYVYAQSGCLVFPDGCTPDCTCRQRIEARAKERVGYDSY
jgi:hypothetical protein